MALDEITNFVSLTADIGTSGQPTRDQFSAIAAAGYKTVINLALPTSDHAIAEEGAIVTGLGLSYFHIPVVFDAPTAENLRTFVAVMRALEGTRVFVHCVVNARVSAFCFKYLHEVRGLPVEEARSPILAKWTPTMSPAWRDFMALPPAAFAAKER